MPRPRGSQQDRGQRQSQQPPVGRHGGADYRMMTDLGKCLRSPNGQRRFRGVAIQIIKGNCSFRVHTLRFAIG
jgi:hypothetical protein